MFTLMYNILSIILLVPGIYSKDSFTIINQPSPTVTRGSIQTITWDTNLTLNEVSIDLYQNSRFISKLGETNKNVKTFAWKVSSTATYGSNYFIKVSVTASNKETAWANTNTFTIGPSKYDKLYIMISVGIICLVLFACCIYKHKYRSYSPYYSDTLLPTATPIINPMYNNTNTGSDATTGFMAGIAADELAHHTVNRSSWFDTQDTTSNNFGDGDFGSAIFGNDGGDTSGGFS